MDRTPRTWWAENAPLLAIAGVGFGLHVATNLNPAYGHFRDELYYLACGDRLALGYVDHPPLIALLARVSRALLGESTVAIRMLPALAGATFVFLSGRIARELGGGSFAQILAAVCALAAPVYLVVFGILSTIPFDHLFWALAAYFTLRLLKTREPRYWLAIGVAIGLGLETKHNMAFFAVAFAVALVLLPERRALATRWPWLALCLAVALAAPHLLWQATHGYPTLEFARNAAAEKHIPLWPHEFLLLQALALNPLTLPVWLAGLASLLRSKEYRLLGVLYLVAGAIFLATRTNRADYLTPIYPILLGAGAVALEGGIARTGLRVACVVVPIAAGAAFVPITLPVLPPGAVAELQRAIGGDPSSERHKDAPIPQHLADRLDWERLSAIVARVHRSLPPSERARATVLTENYGEAGAIALYGRRLGLPAPISGHNNYYLWGPGSATGEVVIAVGVARRDLEELFASVEPRATMTCEFCTSDENDLPIFVARGPKRSLRRLWPALRRYE